MSARPTFVAMLDADEQACGRAARTGLRFVSAQLLLAGRVAHEVTALRVRGRIVMRRAGESLDELEERANPCGSWRAMPAPVVDQVDRALTLEEWFAAVELHDELRAAVSGQREGGDDE